MQEKPENKGFLDGGGDPGRIRTCDLQLRRLSRKLDGSTRVDTFWRLKTGLYSEKLTLTCAIDRRRGSNGSSGAQNGGVLARPSYRWAMTRL